MFKSYIVTKKSLKLKKKIQLLVGQHVVIIPPFVPATHMPVAAHDATYPVTPEIVVATNFIV